MSGLDEVEEWLRERSVLLVTFEEYSKQMISHYMKNPDRNVLYIIVELQIVD